MIQAFAFTVELRTVAERGLPDPDCAFAGMIYRRCWAHNSMCVPQLSGSGSGSWRQGCARRRSLRLG
jgi:hypothetical protein